MRRKSVIALSTGFSRYPWKAELTANARGGLSKVDKEVI